MTHTPSKENRLYPMCHSLIGKEAGGVSPAALETAYPDSSLHLPASPDTQTDLLPAFLAVAEPGHPGKAPRFRHQARQAQPYKARTEGFLSIQICRNRVTSGMSRVAPKHAHAVNIAARQWLDVISSANFTVTKPRAAERTIEEKGGNPKRRLCYWFEDFNRLMWGQQRRPSFYCIGTDLAMTPGDLAIEK